MSAKELNNFTFVSEGLPKDTFRVIRFKGEEGLSMVYEFEIELVSSEPELDLNDVVQNSAKLHIHRDEGDDMVFNGTSCARFWVKGCASPTMPTEFRVPASRR